MNHLRDGETQSKLARHIADETRHAWLLTRRIVELGGSPRNIGEAGYQRQLGSSIGLPRDVIDLLALTLVAEERALDRYTTGAEHPAVVFIHQVWAESRRNSLGFLPSPP
jgi:bacterioferritin (cytochrome b1)